MSRLHVHLHARDFEQSVRFYTRLFGAEPTRREAGYAKWMLEEPKLNFALSIGGERPGLGHLGIQADSEEELASVTERARDAGGATLIERGARCCYATGNKAWTEDPQGVRWEMFHTTGQLDEPGHGADEIFVAKEESAANEPSNATCGCGCGCSANVCCL
jgi:catechol 2,3-dioxygenase-like lactoylglutathione lyase family enzyme